MMLSVIIVNYNVKYFLEQALLSVRKAAKGLAIDVFVVDNNSSDGSVEMLYARFPEVTVLANLNNTGFSVANNQAIRLSNAKYILLLNPDTIVAEDTFQRCIEFMENHSEAGGLGVRMIDGTGQFLPESKRGFPSPWVAFCKTFGLSALFPKSKRFNRYYLGFLDKNQTNEVEVLAGAFMLMRRTALDKVGLLDEAFFMYGEDIDLSYRIVQGGYKNYYLADTTILHYKGESTKRGSLNYVKTFYQAMIIFAKKHFQGEQANFFVGMLQLAIYFRATLTILSNVFKTWYLPLLDALLMLFGMLVIKDIWAIRYYHNPHYFPLSISYFNIPIYIFIWLTSVYFNGGYDRRDNLHSLVRGLIIGTLLIAAVYGFLDLEYRSSRMVVLLSAVWATISTIGLRLIFHFLAYKNLKIGQKKEKNVLIVGDKEESERLQKLLYDVQVQKKWIGTVSPNASLFNAQQNIGSFEEIKKWTTIYKVNELIFCANTLSSVQIIQTMEQLGNGIAYRILPEGMSSIIGSSSKNTQGELYTNETRYEITTSMNRRNKRVLDILVALFGLLCFPLLAFIVPKPFSFLINICLVLSKKRTWVGYIPSASNVELPHILPSILSPASAFDVEIKDSATLKRLNFMYAKEYQPSHDLEILWKGWRKNA
jgi:GT2 family glycosyltransferase